MGVRGDKNPGGRARPGGLGVTPGEEFAWEGKDLACRSFSRALVSRKAGAAKRLFPGEQVKNSLK
jgi:hypothetical protein